MTEARQTKDLRSHLRSEWVVGDGAMATMLHQSGVPVRACYEELNVTMPALVRDVHKAYIDAGASVIQTNTFSAHRAGLRRYGLERRVLDINRAAAEVAKAAAGENAYVLGTIGSTEDLGMSSLHLPEYRRSLEAVYEEQATALLAESVDGILLETFADLEEMIIALEVVRACTHLPILANLSPDAIGVTRDGYAISEAFAAMRKSGADGVGLNCRLGLAGILRTYEKLPLKDGEVYAAVPNAGLLHLVDGDYAYTANADYFADMGFQLVQCGVKFVGGCCGTTPEHIRRLVNRLNGCPQSAESEGQLDDEVTGPTGPRPQPARQRAAQVVDRGRAAYPAGHHHSNADGDLLEQVAREVTVIVELDPPKTLDVARYLEGAKALQEAGADFITLADNSLGTVRVSNMALASILQGMGIQPLVHVTCRDRNLIGQQSHLMGLHVLGIQHILLVTGDPSRFGDLPGATSVYDVSSIDLTKMVQRLNSGVAFSGQSLKQPASFVVGTSFNPNVTHFAKAADRLRRKVAAGADYVMTQPIFEERVFESVALLGEEIGVPVFAGVIPLVSARNANFLHNEVPGIQIPAGILERMAQAPADTVRRVGLQIAEELVDMATGYFRGLYLITPFLQFDLTAHLTQYAHELGEKKQSASI